MEKSAFSTTAEIEKAQEALARTAHPVEDWPGDDSAVEESLVTGCNAVFTGAPGSDRCAAELRRILGSAGYANLVALLASIRSAHLWIEAHPEVSYEQHSTVRRNLPALLQSEPGLAEFFRNYKELSGNRALRVQGAASGENAYRDLFENASDIIYTHDFEGNLLSVNRAVERITGYTRSEALQMKITDIIAPEYGLWD